MDRGSGTPVTPENQDFRAENTQGPERRPRPIIWYHFQPQIPTSNHFRQPFSCFFVKGFFKKHETQSFWASLEPWGPRDPRYVQERQILFRIALTRALYDHTAPQLCPFYVPEKLSFSCLVFIWILPPFCYLENTGRGKGKLQSVQLHIVFLLSPT